MNDAVLLKTYIDAGFGKPTEPKKYSIQEKDYTLAIAVAYNSPYEDLNSYSTFGLSKYELNGENGKMPFRVELLSASMTENKDYENILLEVASFFIDNNICLAPGSTLRNGAENSGINYGQLPHLYLSLPMYWQHNFDGVYLTNCEVKFLCVFPISEAEYNYCTKYGHEQFENLLEKEQTDLFNINRNSIL